MCNYITCLVLWSHLWKHVEYIMIIYSSHIKSPTKYFSRNKNLKCLQRARQEKGLNTNNEM